MVVEGLGGSSLPQCIVTEEGGSQEMGWRVRCEGRFQSSRIGLSIHYDLCALG